MSEWLSSAKANSKALIIFVLFILTIEKSTSMRTSKLTQKSPLDVSPGSLRNDHESLEAASSDYGHIIKDVPSAVLYPFSIDDIKALLLMANKPSQSLRIAARGEGHSVRGQSMVRDGIVVNMTALRKKNDVKVIEGPSGQFYADVGGHELWVNVLNATLKQGLSPVSWTDYLYLSVGGTLSAAGISGQAFRFGPQISNVLEVDVVTGKGDFITCSPSEQPDLFFGVLGGLGQFGIITRARIALGPAPTKVKWVRILYDDFSAFANDQEELISLKGFYKKNSPDYVEGQLLLNQGNPDLSFFPPADHPRIMSLVTNSGIVYCIELAKYYDDSTQDRVDKELEHMLKKLSFVPGYAFVKDVSYFEFLNRVKTEELILRSQGLWDVPHPWLNIFIPKSRMPDIDRGVFKDIILKQNLTAGLVLIYPMNRDKWDDRMSAVTPDEEVFYVVGVLHAAVSVDYKLYDAQNNEIMKFCSDSGISAKQYLPLYKTTEEWKTHFGPKWESFRELKDRFDPKKLLSPGQGIFNN